MSLCQATTAKFALRQPWCQLSSTCKACAQYSSNSVNSPAMAPGKPYADVHKEPKGPGDARPTAMQIVEDQGLIGKLKGKVFVVTGASSGIGIETVRAVHAAGADVIMAVRSVDKAKEVAGDIKKSNEKHGSDGKLEVMHVDLNSLESVRKFAQNFNDTHKQLNVLITNAGVMACPESTTEDGFETQFGTNHLAHFLLFQLLKPTLLASSTPEFNSRVVALSSLGHRSATVQFDDLDFKKQGYQPFVAYGQSKTANIWMANEIERRFGAQGLHAMSVHPGGIQTNLSRHLPPDFSKKFAADDKVKAMMKSPEQGAATSVWCAVGKEWEGTGGKYTEDCGVSEPVREDDGTLGLNDPGYKPHAYDAEGAKKLWELSAKMTGVEE